MLKSLFVAGVVLTQCAIGFCDERLPPSRESDARLESMRSLIQAMKVKPADRDSKLATQFEPKPLLRFGDAVRKASDGSLWKLGAGRPEVLVGLEFQTVNGKPSMGYEFLCLTDERFELRGGDNWTWTPKKSALEFQPITGADPPHESATVRLRQMKQLAKRFSAMEHHYEDYALRLLPQPIDQYVINPKDSNDRGALFVLAHGTNPEIALLIEPRDDGWQYALGRLSGAKSEVRLDDRVVWQRKPMYEIGLSWQGEYICVNHPIDAAAARDGE